MKKLYQNIMSEPGELVRTLEFTTTGGLRQLDAAAGIVAGARHVYVTGIGSSWHAGMAAASMFGRYGMPVTLFDASDLVHFISFAPESCIIVLSRSGKSVEIVNIIGKAQTAGVKIIAITNTPESPLGQEAAVVLELKAAFDNLISITMYSALSLVAGLLACRCAGVLIAATTAGLKNALLESERNLNTWQRLVDGHSWFTDGASVYFLGRSSSLASAFESRLLWEEACKAPASSYTTGGFRHGPQEILEPGVRICLFITNSTLRTADLRLVSDMRKQGASVMLIGQGLFNSLADLCLSLPSISDEWQFLIDIIPAQIAAEYYSRLRGVDCDSFRLCPYIIETEGGLQTTA